MILVRHGQADESQIDIVPLTPLGQKQANLAGKRLEETNIKFNVFKTSSLIRAIQTGEIIRKYLDESVSPSQDPFLNEGRGAIPDPNAANLNEVCKFIIKIQKEKNKSKIHDNNLTRT